jgi:MFS family permease
MSNATASSEILGDAFGAPNTNARRATVAAFLGSTLEYYDLFIYGAAAALVFPTLFFASGDSVAAVAASLATFGAAYVVRPLGAVVWGHLGDRLGRKRILVLTLILMGAATLVIGLLPTYDQIGPFAPILLVAFRLVQGFSAAGESAGSSTLTIEHAPKNRRGFLASFTMAGCMVGTVFASLIFIPITALPTDQLMSWGWRIPFILSLVLLIVAFVIRRSVEETPVFETEVKESKAPKAPIVTLFRTQWLSVVLVFLGSFFAMIQTLFLVFGLSFATSPSVGIPASTMLLIQGVATAICAVLTPVWAILSDRVGRKPVWIVAALASGILIFVYFWTISTGNIAGIWVVGILMFGVAYSGLNGLWPAFFSEQFTASVRFSGLAIGVQTGLLVAGFAPTISVALAGADFNWLPVGIFGAAAALIAGLGMLFARETFRTPTDKLGTTQN